MSIKSELTPTFARLQQFVTSSGSLMRPLGAMSSGALLMMGALSGCSGTEETPSPSPEVTPTATAAPEITPTATSPVEATPTATPTATPEPTPTLEESIRSELDTGRWSTDNYEKLVEFLVKYSEENPERPENHPFAVFDADKTIWGGDQGEAPFAYMLRNLKFSEDLSTVLADKVTVGANGFGVASGGVMFASFRVQEALNAMLSRYRAVVDGDANMQAFLNGFSESMAFGTGPLATDTTFLNAYSVFKGTMVALYQQLDVNVGPVGFDFSTATDATNKYSSYIQDFYAWETTSGAKKLSSYYKDITGDGNPDILFPTIKDGTEAQLTYQMAGELGDYAQVAVWEALGKTPLELKELSTEAFENNPLGQVITGVVPLDAPGTTTPESLDFTLSADSFAAGASPLSGVTNGAVSMEYGNVQRDEIINLMDVMRAHGITPVVVTASQTDLVASIATPRYGVEEQYVMGIQPRLLEAGTYENWLLNPVTYRPGKVDATMELAEMITGDPSARPVFCAGDSNTDFEFVAYSDDYRLFFDRAKVPLMEMATWLTDNGHAESTVIQTPFE